VQIQCLDHLVLTVRDIDASLTFYSSVLGMQVVTFGANRKALAFGTQKINLHQAGREFEPKAAAPTPGSADLCFLTLESLEFVISHLQSGGVPVIQGPVQRTGAMGPIRSVYIRDPDNNLIEIANRLSPPSDCHLVHANVAHAKGSLDSPVMADFMSQIEEINGLAHRMAGFVAQPTPPDDGALYKAPFLLNVSIWESFEALDAFTHQGKHAIALARRVEWFHQEGTSPKYVLYWITKGHCVTEREVKERLDHLGKHGATPFAFTFEQPFPSSAGGGLSATDAAVLSLDG
jgi:catechol 2,3-dioxygenase-like lactoylglutathione lyase family enzyme